MTKVDAASVEVGAEKQQGFADWLERAFVPLLSLCVLPNLLGLAGFTQLSRFVSGWFNIEFAVLGALYLLRPSRLLLLLAGVCAAADLFDPISKLYCFGRADAVRALQYVEFVPPLRLLLYASLILLYLSVLLWPVIFAGRQPFQARVKTAIVVLALSCILLGANVAVRFVRPGGDALVHAPARRVVRFPAITVGSAVVHAIRAILLPRQGVAVDSASKHALAHFSLLQLRPNVVIVLVESWGLVNESSAASTLTAAYMNPAIAARYDISTGQVPFSGATVSGETRELCGEQFGTDVATATEHQLANCLPNQLHRMGYETVGIHGFAARMYGRMYWYPKAGLERALFAPDLAAQGLHECPAGLVGICDAEVATVLHNQLLSGTTTHPVFANWVTINSHLPIAITPERLQKGSCSSQPDELQDQTLCVWAELVRTVHQSVAEIAVDPALRPTVWIVVGDHTPPFGTPARADLFSRSVVPYVILTPKLPRSLTTAVRHGNRITSSPLKPRDEQPQS